MWKRNALWALAAIFALGALIALLSPAKAVNRNIGNDELVKLQAAGAVLLDVRTPGEFAQAHLPQAVNVPMDQLTSSVASWDKNRAVIVYCATGARSANAAAFLAGQGFREVYNLTEGIVAWNGETEAGGSAGELPATPKTVETNGKPLFIDFAGSN